MKAIQELIKRLHAHNIWEGEKTLARNEYLLKAGQKDSNLYFIKSGSIRIFIADGTDEHSIRFGYTHSIIAALDSFLSGSPSEMFLQAIKKTTLKWVSKSAYMEFISSDPKHMTLWNELLTEFILQQMQREQDLLTSSPAGRYQRVLQRSPHLFQAIPHKYIASYLRMTPETLSRIKSIDLNQGE